MWTISWRGDFLEGYILNDLANEVLFNASNAMNRRLYNEFKAQGYHLSTRLTPGENHLSMEYQAQFLSLLTQGEPFPATLTEHYMLQPEKAMLYAYGAGTGLLTGPSITTAPNARISRAICAGTRIRKQEAAFMEYTVRIAGTPCETRVSGGTLAEACALLGHPLELVCGGNGRCGKCDVLVERRGVRETVRACITPVTEDITVFLEVSENASAQILTSGGARCLRPRGDESRSLPAEREPEHCGAYLRGVSLAAARQFFPARTATRRKSRSRSSAMRIHSSACSAAIRRSVFTAPPWTSAQRPSPCISTILRPALFSTPARRSTARSGTARMSSRASSTP